MENCFEVNLNDISSYKKTALDAIESRLKNFYGIIEHLTVEKIQSEVQEINRYENLDSLKPISKEDIIILKDDIPTKNAEECILNGRFFWEHAAAGEATRLGLGTKFLLNLKDLSTEQIVQMIKNEEKKDNPDLSDIEIDKKVDVENIKKVMGCTPEDLLDISLGARHMLQMSFDVAKLAKKYGKDPDEVLKKQSTLVILNESTAEEIISQFEKFNFFGLSSKNVFFMIQKSFSGIDIKDGKLFYDEHNNNKRLHNHGQMFMQKCHDNSIFFIKEGKKHYLSADEFRSILEKHDDMLSFNIEDIGYLTSAIDLQSLSLALDLKVKGFNMVMEIVAQNPYKPQKGGGAFFDKKLNRVVMIESNRLLGIKNEEITHLNKNFNHYPDPVVAWSTVKEKGLPFPFDIKKAKDIDGNDKLYIYPCAVQGDINFIVNTAYVMREVVKPISNWKSPATTPPTINACFNQDNQEGFKEFAQKYGVIK